MHGWSLEGKLAKGFPHFTGQDPTPTERHAAEFFRDKDVMLPDDRIEAHKRMSKLSTRAQLHDQSGQSRSAFWRDVLPPAATAEANPDLPSGYTYLLQLIAHDLVDTGPAALVAGSASANGRSRPLMLDTLYGSGPDSLPAIFDASDKVTNLMSFPDADRAPRRYFRTAPAAGARPETPGFCPFSDIARASQINDGNATACDPMIADARNDSHAIMSQFTVLMHVLHNTIVRLVGEPVTGASRIELSYRCFALARTVVTLIYRRIVRNDVLPRILHPAVSAFYGHTTGFNTPLLLPYAGVSLEFTRGAFRFGHSMVRDNYKINRPHHRNHPNGAFLSLNSARKPEDMPLKDVWMVDWGLFFDMNHPARPETDLNLSHRIGPRYSNAADSSEEFDAKSEFDVGGLMHRDLKSALYSGMWPVPALMERIGKVATDRSPDLAAVLPKWPQQRELLVAWLGQQSSDDRFKLKAEDISKIANDPPLPFYIGFEAAMDPNATEPTTTGMGRHLGPLGSIIVAETLLGALRSNTLVKDEHTLPLKDAIIAAMRDLLGVETPLVLRGLTDVPEAPATMPALLRFLKGAGAFSGQ